MDKIIGMDSEMRTMLNELSRLKMDAGRDKHPASTSNSTAFSGILQEALENVNHSQRESRELARAFELGEQTNLVEVMVARQKARLHFQSTLQVRNRLVSAYQELMRMSL